MSRKNAANIKKYNDKLHKEQAKKKQAEQLRKERLTAILKQHQASSDTPSNPTIEEENAF